MLLPSCTTNLGDSHLISVTPALEYNWLWISDVETMFLVLEKSFICLCLLRPFQSAWTMICLRPASCHTCNAQCACSVYGSYLLLANHHCNVHSDQSFRARISGSVSSREAQVNTHQIDNEITHRKQNYNVTQSNKLSHLLAVESKPFYN